MEAQKVFQALHDITYMLFLHNQMLTLTVWTFITSVMKAFDVSVLIRSRMEQQKYFALIFFLIAWVTFLFIFLFLNLIGKYYYLVFASILICFRTILMFLYFLAQAVIWLNSLSL